jgi:hypothetical protein
MNMTIGFGTLSHRNCTARALWASYVCGINAVAVIIFISHPSLSFFL